MKLSRLLFWLFSAFTLIFTVYCLTCCGSKTNTHNDKEKPLYLPQAENDNIMTVISGIDKDGKADDVRYEDELPPEEFIGTIIEEHFDYIIVEPNIDEEEYKIAKKIRIDFIKTQGKDYLFGTGRKVHITYIPHINVTDGMGYIETDAIETEGFEDFELSVIPNEADITTLVLNNNSLHEFNP